MEFHLPRLLTGVSIDILYPDNLRYIFDDLDEFVHLVNLNQINELLLEELHQLLVPHLGQQFGVLQCQLLKFRCEQMQQVFDPRIWHCNLNHFLAESLQLDCVTGYFINVDLVVL